MCYQHHFFPGLFFCVYVESPNSKKPRMPPTTGPKPHQLKTPTSKTQSNTPTPKPKNHHKWAKIRKFYKELPWEKNIACYQYVDCNALAHYYWNCKKAVVVHTHCNFISQLPQLFPQLCIWATISRQLFYKVFAVSVEGCKGFKWKWNNCVLYLTTFVYLR